MKKSLFIFSGLIILSFLIIGGGVIAQETRPTEAIPTAETQTETAVPEEIQKAIEVAADKTLKEEQKPETVKMDTEVKPEDLGVKKARVLPDSPFYGFKNLFRGLRSTLTFNPIKKAEYQLKVSNEKMVEAQQLIEERKTDKARELASKTIEDANRNLEKIAKQGDKLKQLKTKQAPAMDKFLNKVADHSLKQQVLLQKLEEQVPEQAFVKIEEARQRHLERFGEVMNKVAEKPEEIRDRFSQVVENQKGSDFKELKAIEILRDLEDKAAPEVREALRLAQDELGRKFERRFLTLPEDSREEKFSNYMEFLPGNPVRQFEALDRMKQSFQSAEAVPVLEIGKDRAVRKFENQFNQFSQDQTRASMMEPWRNGDPEDLRTMTEIQMRIEPPPTGEAPESAIYQQFQPFQQEAKNNFRERFSQNPEALRDDPLFQRMRENPDIVDLQFSRELNQIMKPVQGPADPNVSNFVQEFQNQTIQKFVENIQRPAPPSLPEGQEFQGPGVPSPPSREGFGFGPPIPGGLEVLREIRQELPPEAQKGINQAIGVQTQMIQRHIRQMDDPVMFQRFEQQIEQNPGIKREIQLRRGPDFFNQMEQRSQEMEKIWQGQREQRWQKMQEINQQMFVPSAGEPGKPAAPQSPEMMRTMSPEMRSKIEEFKNVRPQSEQPPMLRPFQGFVPQEGARQLEGGVPQRPIIPLPGSPGFSGPPGAPPKPEEIQPPSTGQIQPIQPQPQEKIQIEPGITPQPEIQPIQPIQPPPPPQPTS